MIWDLPSNRSTPLPEVYIYDYLYPKLRGQLAHLVRELCKMAGDADEIDYVYDQLLREWGMEFLTARHTRTDEDIVAYCGSGASVEHILDTIELFVRVLRLHAKKEDLRLADASLSRTVADINHRMRVGGLGFELVDDKFMRVDSQLAHKEIVLPALCLLADPVYSVPDSEYRSAHEHFRHGRYAECLVDCCKAFESVLKVICTIKGWAFNQTDTASKLVKILDTKGLFPPFMGNQLTQLTGLLDGTVNTVRNKMGGHGAGATPVNVPEEYAAFALHSTAADVLLLAKLAK